MTRWSEGFCAEAHQALVRGEVHDIGLGDPSEPFMYLYGRGVSREQIDQYQLGYVEALPSDVPARLKEHRRKLRDCIVYPLTNVAGEVIGVQFRNLHRKVYFDYVEDETQPVVFGMHVAYPYVWDTRSILLVEGVHDLFPVQRVFPGTVSTLSSMVSETFRRTLLRLVDDVYVCYDQDGPGKSAAYQIKRDFCDMAESGLSVPDVHVVRYPCAVTVDGQSSKDPCGLWEVVGEERFQRILQRVL